MGEEAHAIAASSSLQSQGLWVPAIRPPTVPMGTSRLRVTLSAAHTDEQVNRLAAGLAGLASADHAPDREGSERKADREGRSTEPGVLAS
jgi:8-amino-7-oxononanoate synthase